MRLRQWPTAKYDTVPMKAEAKCPSCEEVAMVATYKKRPNGKRIYRCLNCQKTTVNPIEISRPRIIEVVYV